MGHLEGNFTPVLYIGRKVNAADWRKHKVVYKMFKILSGITVTPTVMIKNYTGTTH